MKQSILALIPARGGSKGLPRKNLAKLGGKSLVAHSVAVALASGLQEKIVVSTDDEEIATEARKCGAEVPFLRPSSLATCTASPVDVTLYTLDQLREMFNYSPEWVLLLQPTSPLRIAEDLRGAWNLAQQANCEAVLSVNEPAQHPLLAYRMTPDRRLEPFFKHQATRRQDLPKAVCPNGAVYLIKVEALRRERTFAPPGTLGNLMPTERSVDIDTAYDLKLASFFLSYR